MNFAKQYIKLKEIMQKWRKNEKIDLIIVEIEKIRNFLTKYLSKSDNLTLLFSYCREVLFFYASVVVSYQVKDTKEYCIEKEYLYKIVEEKQMRQICEPSYFEICKETIRTKVSPEIFIAELENIRVVGANSFLIEGNYCLYDLISNDCHERYDLRFESLLKIDRQKALVAEKKKNNVQKVIPEAICLVGVAAYNYYHLTVEILSRLIYIDKTEKYRELPLLVDCIVGEVPQFLDLLKKLNKYDHPIIYLKDRENVEVKKLIYPSYNVWMPVNIRKHGKMRPEDFLISSSAVWNIRNCILQGRTVDEKSINKKIFVSRRNNKTKRLVNEEKIAKMFVEYGFEIMYPEEMSFEEQIDTYLKTKYFACSTGAALTNIIYAPNNAHIICIIPRKYGFFLFSTMAYILGQKCTFLNAEVVKENEALSKDDFKLDEEYCKRFLETLDKEYQGDNT